MKCTVVYPGQFVVWVTCLIREYEDLIIAGMVKKGYMVSPASVSGDITSGSKESVAVVICFRVDSSKEDITVENINTDLKSVLEDKKVLYYSIVVSALTNSCWNTSNISIPKPVSTAPPPLPGSDKSNLN